MSSTTCEVELHNGLNTNREGGSEMSQVDLAPLPLCNPSRIESSPSDS